MSSQPARGPDGGAIYRWRQRQLLLQHVIVATVATALLFGGFYAVGGADATHGVLFASAALAVALASTRLSITISRRRQARWDQELDERPE